MVVLPNMGLLVNEGLECLHQRSDGEIGRIQRNFVYGAADMVAETILAVVTAGIFFPLECDQAVGEGVVKQALVEPVVCFLKLLIDLLGGGCV